MFTPQEFLPQDPAFVINHIKANPFGLLITRHSDQMMGTHLPFLVQQNPNGYSLLGHIAAQNPQNQTFAGESLAIFTGPHAYISPRWYSAHQNVGTWNYTAVHVYGEIVFFSDNQRVMSFFKQLYQTFDPLALPHLESQDPQYLQNLFSYLRCFEFKINRIEATAKLSQNKTLPDRSNIAKHLQAINTDNSLKIAEMMGF